MLEEKIKAIIAECLALDQVNPEDSLKDLGLDSLDLLDLEFRLNNAFEGRLHLEEEAVVQWQTVGDIISAVISQVQ